MNVAAIPLGNAELEGRNNAYLIRSAGEKGLIDTGTDRPAIRNQLRTGLADHGVRLDEISTVFVTHWHPDHSGLAGWVQQVSGAGIYAHTLDAPLVRKTVRAIRNLRERSLERIEKWNLPPRARSKVSAIREETFDLIHPTTEVNAVTGGDVLPIGEIELRTVFCPGHTVGSSCFEYTTPGGRAAFVGDILLPSYTPNIGIDSRVASPLDTYLESLDRLTGREYERVWPGHRSPIRSPGVRARSITAHHEDRLEKIRSLLQAECPLGLWEVATRLFGDMDGVHIRLGLCETEAHLQYLQVRGDVIRTADGFVVKSGGGPGSWRRSDTGSPPGSGNR